MSSLLCAGLGARPAAAAGWATRPSTWVVPFAAGGPSDSFARTLAASVSQELGQAVVVDNKSGAGGTVGAAMVAGTVPDGHTLLVGFTGHGYAELIYAHPRFNLMRDFAPISAIDRVQSVLLVNPHRLDVSSLQQFLDEARRRPGEIVLASGGLGTVPHLAIRLLCTRTGVTLGHVPYRGGAPALNDLLAGQVDAMFGTAAMTAAHVAEGRLRALAVAGRRREPLLSSVPTFEEAGLAGFRAVSWDGLFAPKATPSDVLDRIHAAVQRALASQRIESEWARLCARVEPETRADFERFVAREAAHWSAIIQAAGIKPQ